MHHQVVGLLGVSDLNPTCLSPCILVPLLLWASGELMPWVAVSALVMLSLGNVCNLSVVLFHDQG